MASMFKPMSDNPELARLFEEAKKLPPMTRAEYEVQRKSWVIGNMMLDHPEMTREHAEKVYDEVTLGPPIALSPIEPEQGGE